MKSRRYEPVAFEIPKENSVDAIFMDTNAVRETGVGMHPDRGSCEHTRGEPLHATHAYLQGCFTSNGAVSQVDRPIRASAGSILPFL